MNIKIIADTAKLNPQMKQSIAEFDKRLSRYCKIGLTLVKPKEDISKYLSKSNYNIGIISDKETISSEQLADKINQMGIYGTSSIAFFIGSSLPQMDEELSITSMNMSASVTTAILYEQIYRSYRILNNQPYHK